jgi:hypothetical protein
MLYLKPFVTILFLLFCQISFAQIDSSNIAETTAIVKPKPIVVVTKKPTPKQNSLRRKLVDSKFKVDSLVIIDSMVKIQLVIDSLRKDSTIKALAKEKLSKIDTTTYASILAIGYLPFGGTPQFIIQKDHHSKNKDELFYILSATIALLAFIKIAFPKYFSNMFGLFFQTTLRSKQTRDQLLQNTFASLLINFLYITCGGIYIALVVQIKGWVSVNFWWLIVYSVSILAIIYIFKFLFLHFIGWVFNTKEAANSYIFIVFLSNKIIAVCLIPFLLILAFTGGQIAEVAFIISIFFIISMLLYRYLVSLTSVRSDLKINPLHFFLYLCTMEMLPLLLIYKVAFNYIGTSI